MRDEIEALYRKAADRRFPTTQNTPRADRARARLLTQIAQCLDDALQLETEYEKEVAEQEGRRTGAAAAAADATKGELDEDESPPPKDPELVPGPPNPPRPKKRTEVA